jgi:hypothetical protein
MNLNLSWIAVADVSLPTVASDARADAHAAKSTPGTDRRSQNPC